MELNTILDTVINGDCLEVLKNMPKDCVDLCVTSPPYNVDLRGYDTYKDLKGHKDYLSWLYQVFEAMKDPLKSGSRVCINVGDGKNGKVPTHSDITQQMLNLGYLPMTTIIWDKRSTSNRTSWGSFKSPSSPTFPTPFEYIMVFAKDSYKLPTKGKTDLTRDEFVQWSMALWTTSRSSHHDAYRKMTRKVHPAPFPEEIPTRLIKMLSWVGATILDPFAGSGTTLIAAKKLQRHYIGIDLSEKYCAHARRRLAETMGITNLFSGQ